MTVVPRTPGPASANLQGRKPREVWRGGASDAMGISILAVCCRGVLDVCLGCDDEATSRSAGRDMQDRSRVAEIERYDGYRGWREGEHYRCQSRAGEADGQYCNFAVHRSCS